MEQRDKSLWEFVHDTYPVNRQLVWLNNCGTVPAGTHIVQAVSQFIKDYSERGVLTEAAGYHEVSWNGKTILRGGSSMAQGVYFVNLKTNETNVVGRMVGF